MTAELEILNSLIAFGVATVTMDRECSPAACSKRQFLAPVARRVMCRCAGTVRSANQVRQIRNHSYHPPSPGLRARAGPRLSTALAAFVCHFLHKRFPWTHDVRERRKAQRGWAHPSLCRWGRQFRQWPLGFSLLFAPNAYRHSRRHAEIANCGSKGPLLNAALIDTEPGGIPAAMTTSLPSSPRSRRPHSDTTSVSSYTNLSSA